MPTTLWGASMNTTQEVKPAKRVTRNLYLDEAQDRALEALAREDGSSVSYHGRKAIADYLAQMSAPESR
jgi:hypothetical protein